MVVDVRTELARPDYDLAKLFTAAASRFFWR